MPLTLSPISTPADFPPLIRCQKISYLTPPDPLYTLFCPPNRPTPEESLAEATQRQLQWHQADPTSNWFKVTTTSDGEKTEEEEEEESGLVDSQGRKIIGGALWHVYHKAPGEGGDEGGDVGCYWWPEEGRKRELADEVMGQMMRTRGERLRGPCLLLGICFVHPRYRRLGAGSQLVSWGTAKADEMGVEAFIEATKDGVPLYEKHGFRVMNEFTLRGELKDMDEGLRRLRDELTWNGFFMWRPVGGRWVEGVTVPGWLK
ncbi:MAG: hypothetical protein LQ343_005632 [Gyalolechia ehrenbergii]|nr:MAG: hypothetical protein LQ343_005632 [Gyalolechia ehrenbergii]